MSPRGVGLLKTARGTFVVGQLTRFNRAVAHTFFVRAFVEDDAIPITGSDGYTAA